MRVYVCIALVMSLVSVALPSDNSGDVFCEEVPRITKDRKILMRPELAAKPRLKRTSKLVIFRVRDCDGQAKLHETDPVTGYVIEYIGPCRSEEPGQYILRDEEAFAYNRTMREWYTKHHKKRSKPKKVRQLEFPVIANPTR
jgi:hypothetical protein